MKCITPQNSRRKKPTRSSAGREVLLPASSRQEPPHRAEAGRVDLGRRLSLRVQDPVTIRVDAAQQVGGNLVADEQSKPWAARGIFKLKCELNLTLVKSSIGLVRNAASVRLDPGFMVMEGSATEKHVTRIRIRL